VSAAVLPKSFGDLECFVPEWSLESEAERHWKRVNSDLPTVRAFHDTVNARIDAIFAYLNTLPILDPKRLDPPDRRLYYLAVTTVEMSHPLDLNWASTEIDDKFPAQRVEMIPIPGR
jgi:hypothetical protein